jgi:hypothetical protein
MLDRSAANNSHKSPIDHFNMYGLTLLDVIWPVKASLYCDTTLPARYGTLKTFVQIFDLTLEP